MVSVGGKWEGNNEKNWDWREKGRKKITLFVREGNGKDKIIYLLEWERNRKGKKLRTCPKLIQNYHKNRQRE